MPLLSSAEEGCLCVVVGTKLDLVEDKTNESHSRSIRSGLQLARELNKDRHFELDSPPFLTTSSLRNENVKDVFEFIFKTLLPAPAGGDTKEMNKKGDLARNCVDLYEQTPSKASSNRPLKCCQGS